MHATGTAECFDRCRRCSLISAGPVAQFNPIASTPSGSSAVSAAPISLPMSIVPVVSTVTSTKIGRRMPRLTIACLHPLTAALVWSRSCEVSTRNASAPPSIRPSACSANVCFRWSYVVWPRLGSFVPGPIEPRTQRTRPSAAPAASTRSRAMRAPAAASSVIRSSMP